MNPSFGNTKKLQREIDYLYNKRPSDRITGVHQVNDRIPLYKMPIGNLTTGFDAVTKAGAMSTATLSLVGGYDNIVVGNEATPSNSYFQLTNRFFTANPIYVHARIKVKALGTTPCVGVRTISATSPYVNFVNQQGFTQVNLNTGQVSLSFADYFETVFQNQFSGAVAVNDVIDVYWEWQFDNQLLIRVSKDKDATELSEAIFAWVPGDTAISASIIYPSFILSDGTYQLLDFEIGVISPYAPKIALLGDSMISSASVAYADTIIGNLEAKLPYKIANFSAPATYIAAHKAALRDLLYVKPEIVFYSAVLEGLMGNDVDAADGNHTIWQTAFSNILDTLTNANILPVVLIPSSTPLYPDSRCDALAAWLDTNYGTSVPYVRRLASEGGFDATGFHMNGAANDIITDKFITTLTNLSLI